MKLVCVVLKFGKLEHRHSGDHIIKLKIDQLIKGSKPRETIIRTTDQEANIKSGLPGRIKLNRIGHVLHLFVADWMDVKLDGIVKKASQMVH